MVDIGSEKPFKAMIKLGIPAIMIMITDEVNGIVDSIFMGQKFGSSAVSSMSIILPIILVFISIASLIAFGSSIIISKRLGSKQIDEARTYAVNSILITLFLGVLSGTILFFTVPNLLNLFSLSHEVYYYGLVYLRIFALAMPIIMLQIILAEMLQIEGRTSTLLKITVVQVIINIVLNYVLLITLDIGVEGAALATVIAQLYQIIAITKLLHSDRSELKIELKNIRLSTKYFKDVIRLGIPSFVSLILLSITLGIESKVIANFGDTQLTVQTILGYIFSLSSSVTQGFTQVGLILLSYSIGAKNKGRFFSILKSSLLVIFVSTLILSLPLIFCSSIVSQIFTSNVNVIALIAVPAIVYGLSTPLIFTTNFILSAMQTIKMEILATVIFFSQQLLLFIPLIMVLKEFGFVTAISAQPAAEIVGALITLLLIPKFLGKAHRCLDDRLVSQ